MSEITLLLEQARQGDRSAWDRVIELLYADLKRLARGASSGQQRHEVTSLVHDCYLRLSRSGAGKIESRAHFLSIASIAMRQILINHARESVASKRGGGATHITLGIVDAQAAAAVHDEASDLLELDKALDVLAREDIRMVRVVECRLFAGLTEEETAESLGMTLRTTQRLWQEARSRLRELLTPPDRTSR